MSAEEAMAEASVELQVCQALTQAPYHPLLFTCNPGMSKLKKILLPPL